MTTSDSPNESSRPADDVPITSEHASASPAPLGENIFLDDADTAPVVARTPQPLPTPIVACATPPPGPGLPEAMLWVFGCFSAHIAGFAAMLVLAIVLSAVSTGQVSQPAEMEQIVQEQMLLLSGGEQFVFVLFAMLAVFLRFGSTRARQLGMRPARLGHALLVVAITLPVAFVSGECFRVATEVWQGAVQLVNDSLAGARWWLPFRQFLRSLDENQTMDVLKEMSGAPLPLLLVIIAVAPALGEELIFRGLIGRGLVARWGVVRGVLLTSLLFGAVHLHPAHALAVIPLGIAMHFVYLTTRSFWAPVLLHFLNNAWATTVTKYSNDFEPTSLMSEHTGLPLPVLIESLVLTLAIGMLLWHTRIRFVLPTGVVWSPGYTTVESPPPQFKAEPVAHAPTRLLVMHGAASLFAFAVVLWNSQ